MFDLYHSESEALICVANEVVGFPLHPGELSPLKKLFVARKDVRRKQLCDAARHSVNGPRFFGIVEFENEVVFAIEEIEFAKRNRKENSGAFVKEAEDFCDLRVAARKNVAQSEPRWNDVGGAAVCFETHLRRTVVQTPGKCKRFCDQFRWVFGRAAVIKGTQLNFSLLNALRKEFGAGNLKGELAEERQNLCLIRGV
jgi:hypothetical protein